MPDILPKNVEDAIRRMIGLTRELIKLTEDEGHALQAKDTDELKVLLARKNDLSVTYEKAGKEFHKRLADFRGVDKKLIAEVLKEQETLKIKAEKNQAVYERLRGNLN